MLAFIRTRKSRVAASLVPQREPHACWRPPQRKSLGPFGSVDAVVLGRGGFAYKVLKEESQVHKIVRPRRDESCVVRFGS